jgi:hypothetical protein
VIYRQHHGHLHQHADDSGQRGPGLESEQANGSSIGTIISQMSRATALLTAAAVRLGLPTASAPARDRYRDGDRQ